MTIGAVDMPPPLVPELADARDVLRRARRVGRARFVFVSVVLAASTVVVFCISLSVGDFPIPLVDVIATLFGGGNQDSDFIIRTLRLPRALTGVLVGGAFGFSGAIFQSLAHNPLASPDIIGITQGATTAAVFLIVIVHAGGTAVSLGALVGALLSATAIYLLAYKRGVSSYRLVLVGVGVGAALVAVTEYLLTRSDIYDAQRATVWLTGSLNGRGWEHVRPLAIALAILVPATLVLGRSLRALQLGDDTAKGLGVGVERARAGLVFVGVALAAIGAAAAGPVAFVALISPPIARRLVRGPLTLVPAALTGALLLTSADLVARQAFGSIELPVGVVTGLIGGPYLIWLLARANKIGRGG